MTKIVKKNKKHADSEKYDGLTFLQSTYIYIVDTIYKVILREFYIYIFCYRMYYILYTTIYGKRGKKYKFKNLKLS